jgi:hypothetical protein
MNINLAQAEDKTVNAGDKEFNALRFVTRARLQSGRKRHKQRSDFSPCGNPLYASHSQSPEQSRYSSSEKRSITFVRANKPVRTHSRSIHPCIDID